MTAIPARAAAPTPSVETDGPLDLHDLYHQMAGFLPGGNAARKRAPAVPGGWVRLARSPRPPRCGRHQRLHQMSPRARVGLPSSRTRKRPCRMPSTRAAGSGWQGGVPGLR